MLKTLKAWGRKLQLRDEDAKTLVFFLLIVTMCAAFLAVKDATFFGDEGWHFDQVTVFLRKKFIVISALTTIPGFHAVIAVVSWLVGSSAMEFLRFVCLGISIASVYVFFLTSRAIEPNATLAKTVQYVFIPILFPLFFLLYTDILSLCLMMLALLLTERKHYALAGVVGAASVLTRQNNIVWFLFLFCVLLYESGMANRLLTLIPWKRAKRFAKIFPHHASADIASWHAIISYGVFYIGIVLFAVFMEVNGGIAVGDKGAHPFPSFHLGNVYFCLALLGLLMLPVHIANTKRVLKFLWTNKFSSALLVGFFVFGMLTFISNHGYNDGLDSAFLRNRTLFYFNMTPLLKAVFFIPATIGFMSLLVTPLKKPIYYLLYPMTLIYLIPSWLIEQRYYFIPLVFFLLFRKQQNTWMEWVTALYSIIFSGILYWIVSTRWLFL